MDFYLMVTALAIAINLYFAFYLIRKNPHFPPYQIVFFIMVFVAAWNASRLFRGFFVLETPVSIALLRIEIITILLIITLFLRFSQLLTAKQYPLWHNYAAFALLVPLVAFTSFFVKGLPTQYYTTVGSAGALMPLFYLYVFVLMVVSIRFLLGARSSVEGAPKRGLELVMVAFGIPLVAGIIDMIIINMGIIAPVIASIATAFTGPVIIYAMLKYHSGKKPKEEAPKENKSAM